MAWSPNHPTHAFKNFPLVGSQYFIWKSIVKLIIVLPKQHYNNPKQIAKYAPDGVDQQNYLTHISL
jgi:hypothetical protein